MERPRVRVLNASGRQVELMATYHSPSAPLTQAYQYLNTEAYPPGVYRLRVEIDFVDAQGKRDMVASAWAPLIVPKRDR